MINCIWVIEKWNKRTCTWCIYATYYKRADARFDYNYFKNNSLEDSYRLTKYIRDYNWEK